MVKVVVFPVILLSFYVEKFMVFALSSLWWCCPQSSTTVMTLSGMGRGVMAHGFLTAPVLMSNTLCVYWRFPVVPNNIPGNVRGCIVFDIVGLSWALT